MRPAAAPCSPTSRRWRRAIRCAARSCSSTPATPTARRRSGIPPRGEAWPDARLAARLGVKAGDALAVGEATLTVGAIVQQEPEVASGLLALGPRLLINSTTCRRRTCCSRAIARRSGCSSPTCRRATRSIRYLAWLQAELKPGQRMENVRDLRPEVRQTLERAEQFLGLAALVAVMLAAVAVALAASRYLRRHLDAAAMLRCFGAPRRQTLALFVLQFAALGVVASAAGIALALARPAAAGRCCWRRSRRPTCRRPGVAAGGHGVRHRRAAAVRLRAAAAGRARERAAAARAAPRPAAAARRRHRSPTRSAPASIALLIAWQAQDAKAGAIMVGGIGGAARRRGARRVAADRRC